MQRSLRLLTLLSLAAAASAQQRTAHPQDSLQNTDASHVPFGATVGSLEGRTHILVPANELPNQPAILTGIEIQSEAATVVDYSNLEIFVSPIGGLSLSSLFAANLSAPQTPMLSAGPRTIAWSSGWTPLPITGTYVHNGSDSLVIEVRKSVLPAAVVPLARSNCSSSPPRTDRPRMFFAAGDAGSGAAAATTATGFGVAIVLRLVWQQTPTLRHRQDQGLAQNQYALGSTVDLTIAGAAGHLWVLAASTAYQSPVLTIPGLVGGLRLASPVIFDQGVLAGTGEAVRPLPLPTTPNFIGFRLVYQGAVIDPATGGGTLTNAADHSVNP